MIDAPAPVSIRRAWIAVAGMFALNGALFGIWASRVPAIADRHGLDHGALGLLLLFLAGGAVCSFPLAGRAADRFGAAATTRVLALVYPLGLILLPLMPGPVSLAGALFVFGALHGAMDVAMNGWGAEVERRYRRPVMSSFHALFSLGAGLGAFSGYVAAGTEMSILAHFATTAAVATVPAVLLARVSWASPRTASAAGSVFALPSGALLLVGVVAFCASLGEGAMADWSAVFLRDVTGADESTAALGYAAFSAAMVAVRLMGDVAIRWLGVAATARAGGICAAIGAALAVASPGAGAVLAGFALMGVGYATIMPLAFSRAANDPAIPQGRAIASVATLAYGGMLLGPPVIGLLAGMTSLQVSFGLLVGLALVVAGLAGALRRPV